MNFFIRIFVICLSLILIKVQCQLNSGFNNQFRNQQRQQQYAPPLLSNSGQCPQPNGTFPTNTCDGYIKCTNGEAKEELCPDGLLFNANAAPYAFPCQYPIDVDCTGREQTQPPQSTEDCPHQYGYYKIGDERNCGQFKNCVDGRGFVFDCPEGLAWNSETYRCDWPDQVNDCDAEAYLGFSCPPDNARQYGLGPGEYRFFRSQNDCQRYFICIEDKPRLYNCGEGRAFNDLTNTCDDAENVTGCAIPEQKNVIQSRSGPVAKFSNKIAYDRFNKF